MMRIVISILGVALALAAGPGVAQDNQPGRGALELKTIVQKVVTTTDASGEVKTELVPVDVAVPGDEVVYTVTFVNVGEHSADHILITNPIPREMRYVGGSAFGPGTKIVYSADGGVSYGEPEALRVVATDGSAHIASADEYTHIRWQLTSPLDVGAKGFARFRAVVR